MGLQHVDIESALRRLADKRIEDAMKEGKFNNLAGAGQLLDLEPMPAEENARLMWWALRILKNNDFTPEEVRWRKAIDHLRSRLDAATEEADVIRLVGQANELIRRLNTLGTNALNIGVAPLDEAEYLQRFRDRRA
ncbi:MAG: hypothetical protein JWN40_5280 [Phycisphaerales bacterium]|nr:hypothetical protein [Phycisphaerales bacterium]